MLDEFCKLFGHLGFSSGALPSSTLLKGIIESLQNVFLRVPINVVGDRDVSIPGLTHHLIHRRRGATRLPVPASVHAHRSTRMQGVRLALGQEGCAHGGDLHTEVACLPPAREVTPPRLRPLPPRCRPRTVYVCYTHARWYVGSKPPPFRPF
ncbi:hypothetical protein PAPYR_7103 [Paratrimastix pyriformis]|uniref:Uncharacterized protein n=1 Tax=Paratrimastix pyriformis TaxID=342808 RepID=A0ABQ8UDR2_9EUKA|nr:hypothetical protein PAPYR_7103 [Paratrimastix pyriformis]